MFYSSNYWGIVSFSIAMIGYVSFLKGHVLGAGHLRGPPLLSVFDITLKTTS